MSIQELDRGEVRTIYMYVWFALNVCVCVCVIKNVMSIQPFVSRMLEMLGCYDVK